MQRLRNLIAGIVAAVTTISGGAVASANHKTKLSEGTRVANASVRFVQQRPKHWLMTAVGYVPAYIDDVSGELVAGRRWVYSAEHACEVPDQRDVETVSDETKTNVKTTVGIDFTHVQTYGSSGLGANGLNYIALSNDTLTETSASTTLSTEIAANGLTRAQGTVAHTTATTTTTVAKTFTATGSQSAQKAALFTAASAGTMNHALAFTARSLISGDTLTITFTLTIS